MARQVAELALYTEDELLCTTGYEEGVHLGQAHGFVRTEVERADETAPTDGPSDAGAVAALRGLFVETGTLYADGAALDETRREGLRERFETDPRDGAEEFASLGLRWQTGRLPEAASVEPRGDVLQTEVHTYALDVAGQRPLPRPGGLRWESIPELWSSWSEGKVLVSPSCGQVLRRLRDGVAPAANRANEWAVAPHLEMLPVKTPTLPPATHTNVFLIGSKQAVLIEPASPYPEELDRIALWVADAAARGIQVEAILATHHHIDHIGGATALSERLGLPLWAHAMTQQRLESVVTFDRILSDGERIELDGPSPTSLTALHTPGHAPGHLCFVDEKSRIMIAGDMVAGVGTILIEPNDGDMALYLDSLQMMAKTEPNALLPAHGGVIRNPQAMLEFYAQHRLMREKKVLDALSTLVSVRNPAELLPLAYDDAPKAVWPLAERSVESHLIKLERDGKVTRRGEGWTLT